MKHGGWPFSSRAVTGLMHHSHTGDHAWLCMQMLEEKRSPAVTRLAILVLQQWPAARQGAAVLQRCQACQSTCCQRAMAGLGSLPDRLAAEWLRAAHAAQRLLICSSTQQPAQARQFQAFSKVHAGSASALHTRM